MKDETIYRIPFDILEAFMTDALKGIGVPEEDAKICADILITQTNEGLISRYRPFKTDLL